MEFFGAVRNISDALGTQQMCLVIILSNRFKKGFKTFFDAQNIIGFVVTEAQIRKKF